jgi:hypothetical protein
VVTVKNPGRDVLPIKLPHHALYAAGYGLGGESSITIDLDAGTVHTVVDTMKKKSDTTRKLTDAERAALVGLEVAAWTDGPGDEKLHATDVRQDVAIASGDDAFYRVGYPLQSSHAADLFAGIYKLYP